MTHLQHNRKNSPSTVGQHCRASCSDSPPHNRCARRRACHGEPFTTRRPRRLLPQHALNIPNQDETSMPFLIYSTINFACLIIMVNEYISNFACPSYTKHATLSSFIHIEQGLNKKHRLTTLFEFLYILS
jgi:hypothetical protein